MNDIKFRAPKSQAESNSPSLDLGYLLQKAMADEADQKKRVCRVAQQKVEPNPSEFVCKKSRVNIILNRIVADMRSQSGWYTLTPSHTATRTTSDKFFNFDADKAIASLKAYMRSREGTFLHAFLDPNDTELINIAKLPSLNLTHADLVNLKDIADEMNGLKKPPAIKGHKVDPNKGKTLHGQTEKQVIFKIECQDISERCAEGVKLLLMGFGVNEWNLRLGDPASDGKDHSAVPDHKQVQKAGAKKRRITIRPMEPKKSDPIFNKAFRLLPF